MSGPLRQGFYDLLIALHLESHATTMEVCKNEYIIPLGEACNKFFLNRFGMNVYRVATNVSYPFLFRPRTERVVRKRRNETQPQVSGDRIGSTSDENDRHQVNRTNGKLNVNPVTNSRHQGMILPATRRSRT